jgi:hypothetical protein
VLDSEAEVHDHAAGDDEPQPEERPAGPRDLGSADLQRHEVDPDRERQRGDREVDHPRAVQREELVVALA